MEDQTEKRTGWATPYGFADFKEPVSYEEACETMKTVRELFQHSKKEKNHD